MHSEDRKERAFVAGATGLTGRYVVQHLRSVDIPTTAHIRPDSSRLQSWSDRFVAQGAEISTAVWDIDSMEEALRLARPTIVFALLGTTKKRSRAGDGDYQTVDYGLTACLIDACCRLENKPRLIYLSAVGVKPDSTSAYYVARAQSEAKLQESGLTGLIARPSFILGDRDDGRPGESLGAPIVDGLLACARVIGAGKLAAPYRSMTGEELASGLVELSRTWPTETIVHVPELRAASRRFVERIPSGNE
jgi:uncharacterized protein YbjT (DUF2867 family)